MKIQAIQVSSDHTPVMDHMRLALSEASAGVACGDGGPFGAVIVNKEGKVVARGHNMVLHEQDPTCHAEVTAIRSACRALGTHILTGCSIYTSCYPCPMCLGACLWARLEGIYYAATSDEAAQHGFDDAEFHDYLKNPQSDEVRKLEYLPIAGALTPFHEWSAKQDKQPY